MTKADFIERTRDTYMSELRARAKGMSSGAVLLEMDAIEEKLALLASVMPDVVPEAKNNAYGV